MTSSTVVDAPAENPGPEPARARGLRRLGARVRRGVLFLALTAVVLSFGLVAGTGDASDHARSFSEIALAEARDNARDLADEARLLAAAGKGPGAEEFRAQGEGLGEQAILLTGPGRTPAAAATGSVPADPQHDPSPETPAAATPGAGLPDGPDRRSLETYVQELTDSAQANLRSAWRADAGTARLLAAAGSAQQVWATRTARLYDLALPAAGNAAAGAEHSGRDTGPENSLSNCPDTGGEGTGADSGDATDGSGGPDGTDSPGSADGTESPGAVAPDAAAALKAAVDAELGTAYAYQVAAAQDPSAAAATGEQWLRRAAEHESRGTDAAARLADVCLPAVAPVAAYRLDPAFLENPADALPALEQRFPAVYADLVALSAGDLRGWAIARLAAVTEELYLEAGTVPAAPGLDAVPDELPWN